MGKKDETWKIIRMILRFYALTGFVTGLNWWLRFVDIPHETMMMQMEIGVLAFAILEISGEEK